MRILHGLGPAALSDGFLFIDHLPTDEQSVSVGEFYGVVVGQALVAVILEVPNEVAVPVEFLDATASGWALEASIAIGRLGGTKEMTIIGQVDRGPAGIFTRP